MKMGASRHSGWAADVGRFRSRWERVNDTLARNVYYYERTDWHIIDVPIR